MKSNYYDFLKCVLGVLKKEKDFSDGKDIVVEYPGDFTDCIGYPFKDTPEKLEDFLTEQTREEEFDKNFTDIFVYDDFSVSLIVHDFNVQVVERIMSKIERAEEKGINPNVWEFRCDFGNDVLKEYFYWIAEKNGYGENKELIAETAFSGARMKRSNDSSYWVRADFECYLLIAFLNRIYKVEDES